MRHNPSRRRRPFRPTLERLDRRDAPAVFTVANLNDAGADSLRDAIAQANNIDVNPGKDTIVFAPGLTGVIPTQSPYFISESVDLQGPAAGGVVVLGLTESQSQGAVFSNAGVDTAVSNLVVRDNAATIPGEGGAFTNRGGLTLTNVLVENTSAAGDGGAVLSVIGSLVVRNSQFVNNGSDGFGGAISATGQLLDVSDTVFTGNDASFGGAIHTAAVQARVVRAQVVTNTGGAGGGGVYANGGTLTLTDSTLDGNFADAPGGGLWAASGASAVVTGSLFTNNSGSTGGGVSYSGTDGFSSLVMTNNTLTGNTAGGAGGGVGLSFGASGFPFFTVDLINNTITGNTADRGGGVGVEPTGASSSAVTMRNNVVAANTATGQLPASPDLSLAFASTGGNLFGDATGGVFTPGPGDTVNPNPGLGTLSANGGPTLTIPLLAGSPAIGIGVTGDPTPTTDQRGVPRPPAGPIDAGAFQTQAFVGTPDFYTTANGTSLFVPAPGVLVNDSPTGGEGLFLTFASKVSSAVGQVTVNPNGQFVFSPAPGFSGDATFTYRVSDGTTESEPVTVTITVLPNVLPTISDVPDATVPVNGTGGPFAFTVGDQETPADSLTVTATTSNAALLPAENVVFGGSGANRTVTVIPLLGQSGTAVVTITVTDGGFGTASDTFTITVPTPPTPPNTGPTISDVADVFLLDGGSGGPFAFTVGDAETPADALVVTASSSNPRLLPAGNVVLGGSGANRTVTVTLAPGVFGERATVTLTVTDANGATATDTFVVVGPPEVFPVPAPGLLAVGAGAGGGPRVQVYALGGSPAGSSPALVHDFFAFEPGFTGGVRVATGDVNGDGVEDVVVGAGAGGAPRVRAFDGATGGTIRDFFAFEPSFIGGVYVAVADVNGDGLSDFVVSAGSLGGPRVTAIDAKTGGKLADFFAYDPRFLGGARVAAADLNRDGRAEIVTVPGAPGAPVVRVFSPSGVQQLEFQGAELGYQGGLFVAARNGSVVVGRDSFASLAGSVLESVAGNLVEIDGSPLAVAPSADTVTGLPQFARFAVATDGSGKIVSATPSDPVNAFGDAPGGVRVAVDRLSTILATGPGDLRLVRILTPVGNSDFTTDLRPFDDSFTGSIYVG